MDTLIASTPVNFSLVADTNLTSPAWSEVSSGSPRSPGFAHWAFNKVCGKISAPQTSLCAANVKASSDTSGFDRMSINSGESSDTEDGTEEDLEDGDYVEPTKPRVTNGGRKRRPSASGDRGECVIVLEMVPVINQSH